MAVQPSARLVLASASPRRSELLAQIGVPHDCVSACIDETRLAHELPEECVRRLAQSKATQVHAALAASRGDVIVLGADTLVLLGAELLGKPHDRAHGLHMLQQLSGRTHRVLSAVAVVSALGIQVASSESEVRLRELSAAECEAYWQSGEPCDKAGGYAIQGLGAIFVASLRGSYSGVMGLPLFESARLLRAAGIVCWRGALA